MGSIPKTRKLLCCAGILELSPPISIPESVELPASLRELALLHKHRGTDITDSFQSSYYETSGETKERYIFGAMNVVKLNKPTGAQVTTWYGCCAEGARVEGCPFTFLLGEKATEAIGKGELVAWGVKRVFGNCRRQPDVEITVEFFEQAAVKEEIAVVEEKVEMGRHQRGDSGERHPVGGMEVRIYG